MPINHARESALHRDGKLALGRLLSIRGFLILFEHLLADLVAVRRGIDGLRILCGEHDTTIRNVGNNVRRDFARGCNSLVILVPDESARAAVRRLLRRDFSRHIQTRIGVLTYDTCRRQLEKLPVDAIDSATSIACAHLNISVNAGKNHRSNKI